ncbi:MAG: MFS transporter [Elusimicrobia bacterium]|nr:MFS transporter [Elusimicrobiota bacterium]
MKDFKSRLLLIGIAIIVVSAFFDNIRGPMLPIFSARYGLSYAQASAFFWASSATSFMVSMLSVPLLARWSERAYVRAALAVQSLAVLCALGGCYPSLIAAGAFWGVGNTAIGLSSNLVVIRGSTDANRPRMMNALHLFYCLGSVVPAFYVALTAGRWPIYAILLPTLALLAALWLCTLALPADGERAPAPQMPWQEMLRPHALLSNLFISVYVLGEVLTSMWLVSYLSGHARLSVSEASGFLQLFFLAMALSRFLAVLLLRPGVEAWLPVPLMLAACAALSAGLAGFRGGFLLAAFFFGPMWPLMASALAKDYPRKYPSLIACIYAVSTVGLALGHVAIGAISDRSLQTAFRLPTVFLLAALFIFALRARASRNHVPEA